MFKLTSYIFLLFVGLCLAYKESELKIETLKPSHFEKGQKLQEQSGEGGLAVNALQGVQSTGVKKKETFERPMGTLADGSEFDSSYGRNQPFDFKIGQGMVIEGWEKGLLGMCVGEKRKLKIPPNMGYGEQGYPPVIPPSSTLTFEVELLDIQNKQS